MSVNDAEVEKSGANYIPLTVRSFLSNDDSPFSVLVLKSGATLPQSVKCDDSNPVLHETPTVL